MSNFWTRWFFVSATYTNPSVLTAIAAGSFNFPFRLPLPPQAVRNVPSGANFWIRSSVWFVTYTLPSTSTARPVGLSITPGPGYIPHAVSNAPPFENRWIRPFPVSATYTWPEDALAIPCGAVSWPSKLPLAATSPSDAPAAS